jgi:hypothetical protein
VLFISRSLGVYNHLPLPSSTPKLGAFTLITPTPCFYRPGILTTPYPLPQLSPVLASPSAPAITVVVPAPASSNTGRCGFLLCLPLVTFFHFTFSRPGTIVQSSHFATSPSVRSHDISTSCLPVSVLCIPILNAATLWGTY